MCLAYPTDFGAVKYQINEIMRRKKLAIGRREILENANEPIFGSLPIFHLFLSSPPIESYSHVSLCLHCLLRVGVRELV